MSKIQKTHETSYYSLKSDSSTSSPKDKKEHDKWTKNFNKLLNYKKKYGDCLVPYNYELNRSLFLWVKRQRYQYSLFMRENKQSNLNLDRIKMLDDIGFVWDLQKTTWEKRLNELIEYRKLHGHCNLPGSYSPNKALGTWVHRQRAQYKLYCAGKQSSLTLERIMELETIGFQWQHHQFKKNDKPRSTKKQEPAVEEQLPDPMTRPPVTFDDYSFFMDVICDLSDDDDDDDLENLDMHTFNNSVPFEWSIGAPCDQTRDLLRSVVDLMDSDSGDDIDDHDDSF